MTLTEEEVESIRQQLREQVENLPGDKKQAALQQIETMSPEAIESLVKQQKSQYSQEKEQKSIFRMIVDKDIDAIQVAENKQSLAVLDINPISKGHVMIIPKSAVPKTKQIPTQCFSLAKRISQNIIKKLSAKSTEIQTETKFGESIVHVIPIFQEPLNINSPRQKSSQEDLKMIADKIKIVKKIKIPRIKQPSKKSESPAIHKKRRIA